MLVEFCLRAAGILDNSFEPKLAWSERVTETVPNKSETVQFKLGEEPISIDVTWRKDYGTAEKIPFQDEISLKCRGLPDGIILELRVLRQCSEPRFVEIRMVGPEPETEAILEEFHRRFGSEYIPLERENEYFLAMAKAAAAINAWRAVEFNARKLLNYDICDPQALMYLGIARAAQGFEPEGENQLLASITLNPNNPEAYYHLGLIVMKQRRCSLASEAFKRGLKLDPTNYSLMYQLGQALECLGEMEPALQAYRQALQHDSNLNGSDYFKRSNFPSKARKSIVRVEKKISESLSHD